MRTYQECGVVWVIAKCHDGKLRLLCRQLIVESRGDKITFLEAHYEVMYMRRSLPFPFHWKVGKLSRTPNSISSPLLLFNCTADSLDSQGDKQTDIDAAFSNEKNLPGHLLETTKVLKRLKLIGHNDHQHGVNVLLFWTFAMLVQINYKSP